MGAGIGQLHRTRGGPARPRTSGSKKASTKPDGSSIMNNGRNDCQRISRRVLLTGTALALGAAAVAAASQAMAQVKISQAVANYQNTPPALRPLHQLPTAECVQIRPGRHQPERLVPV